MSEHLLLITLGPIQDFIAAARRTRDLWFGSHLLSELSRAAAATVGDRGTLIFPALEPDDDELTPCDTLVREKTGKPPLSIANKILVRVNADQDPRQLADDARQAAKTRLTELAATAYHNAAGVIAADCDDLFDEQIATLLEFCAAWEPLGAGEQAYAEARRRVEQAVAGRKNLREFKPWRCHRDGAPKSSLDGARDSLLREANPSDDPSKREERTVKKYRLGDNEQLDGVGILKRCGGEPEQFVPLRNLAVAAWLATASAEAKDRLNAVRDACRGLPDLPRVSRDIACAKLFGHDAEVFFPDRWPALRKELSLSPEGLAPLQSAVRLLHRAVGEPPPYLCCLVADGDRMGVALDGMRTAEQHREFSQALADFAPLAREIIESGDHLGALVYAGGDDVLAFAPVARAIACADQLRRRFEQVMKKACPGRDQPPTLSVGLGIGHSLTGMGDLLELGRQAEKLAKKERNSLAILVQKRSGGLDQWTASWTADAAPSISDGVTALAEKLPAKKVAEVRERLRRSPKPDDPLAGSDWANVLRQEVGRILARAEGGQRNLRPADVGLNPSGDAYPAVWQAVDDWVNRMRIAMVFEAAAPHSKTKEAVR